MACASSSVKWLSFVGSASGLARISRSLLAPPHEDALSHALRVAMLEMRARSEVDVNNDDERAVERAPPE